MLIYNYLKTIVARLIDIDVEFFKKRFQNISYEINDGFSSDICKILKIHSLLVFEIFKSKIFIT